MSDIIDNFDNLISITYRLIIKTCTKIVPYFIRIRLDPEAFGIISFMELASQLIKPNELILDAGAGKCPYKSYFSQAHYESMDIIDKLENPYKHTFICDIKNIPREDNYYDTIINTQVLEHVEFPQKIINEFYRILKYEGKLFLSAPQAWGIHEAPYNFYNFTKYGLESLFRNAGFKIVFINPRGGIFWYLSKILNKLPFEILYQYKNKPLRFLLLLIPTVIIYPITGLLIPLCFYYFDRLDKIKNFTLGYACYCIKEPTVIK
jgi:SAM-dependent methyltransferase